jgi:hypothetical protein
MPYVIAVTSSWYGGWYSSRPDTHWLIEDENGDIASFSSREEADEAESNLGPVYLAHGQAGQSHEVRYISPAEWKEAVKKSRITGNNSWFGARKVKE